MPTGQDYRDRDDVEVDVLDALVDRSEDGMTVFEIRTQVDADIDDLEAALAHLKDDGLITVENEASRTVILPDERVLPAPDHEDPEPSLYDRLRDRFPF